MKINYLPGLRPKANVMVDGVDIGVGGTEMTPKLWNHIKQKIMSSKNGFKLDISLRENSNGQIGYMGIRIVGSERAACSFRAPYYQNLFSIMDVMKSNVIDQDALAQYRVWKYVEYRQGNKSFAVSITVTMMVLLRLSKHIWKRQQGGANTNCVYFRSDWGTFTVSDKENEQKGVKWDSKSNTSLASFRGALKELFGEKSLEAYTSFAIFELPQTTRQYVVNNETTEGEWCKHVFDWFHSPHLQVMSKTGIDYSKSRNRCQSEHSMILSSDPHYLRASTIAASGINKPSY
jgi:hypothetical protein